MQQCQQGRAINLNLLCQDSPPGGPILHYKTLWHLSSPWRHGLLAAFLLSILAGTLSIGPAHAQNAGYWQDAERDFATTQFGNVVAVAAHNCYVDDSTESLKNLERTLTKIHAAQADGADLIELDIHANGKDIFVSHDDDRNTSSAKLTDVLADARLRSGNQVLYLEMKENFPTAPFARSLLEQISQAGVATKGRPVVFRAFSKRRRSLLLLQQALKHDSFASLRDHVRFHEFIQPNGPGDDANFHRRILKAQQAGFHGVEFEFDTSNLFAAIGYAKSLGLGVGLFTIPARFGEALVAGFREDVDALVVDYPVRKSRDVVEENNGLIYFNSRELKSQDKKVNYQSNSPDQKAFEIDSLASPKLLTAKQGSVFFGTAMTFSSNRSVSLFDADNRQQDGYLITACLGIFDTTLPDGDVQSIFAKSDNGGFTLELHNPPGPTKTQLRYGVRVADQYVYASYPANKLNSAESYYIIAAYDGNGGVRMWINGSDENVSTINAVGGVVQNNSPVVIGADPQGPSGKRFYFRGIIQQVQLQNWREH